MSAAAPSHHLAQANVAYLLAPHDAPQTVDYIARLDELNQLADASPGFIWRYLTDSRDPLQREFPDPLVLFNMSVWTSIEALHAYTYRTAHATAYAQRKKWFAATPGVVGGHALAMWWITPSTIPTVADAKHRLELIEALGPSREAFTFKQRFAAPLSE